MILSLILTIVAIVLYKLFGNIGPTCMIISPMVVCIYTTVKHTYTAKDLHLNKDHAQKAMKLFLLSGVVMLAIYSATLIALLLAFKIDKEFIQIATIWITFHVSQHLLQLVRYHGKKWIADNFAF